MPIATHCAEENQVHDQCGKKQELPASPQWINNEEATNQLDASVEVDDWAANNSDTEAFSDDDDDEEGFVGWTAWSPKSYRQPREGFQGLLQ